MDLIEQVTSVPAHDLALESVHPGLCLGKFARTRPFDPAEVGVHDHDALAGAALGVRDLDNVGQHGL